MDLMYICSAIHAPDFRQELNDLLAKEQQKLKDFVLEQTRDQKQILVDYVRQQQVISLMTLHSSWRTSQLNSISNCDIQIAFRST